MKKLILAFFFTLLLPSMALAANDDNLQVRLMADPAPTSYSGDSLLVSVVLYASAPIAQASCPDDLSFKGTTYSLRQLRIDRQATAGQVRERGRIYYTLVWAQYVVKTPKAGRLIAQPLKFKATLQQIVRMPDLMGQMMGERPEYREIKAKATSQSLTIEVTDKPLRSTEEMLHDSRATML